MAAGPPRGDDRHRRMLIGDPVVMIMMRWRNQSPAGQEPLVDEIETDGAESEARQNVDGDGQERAASLSPDGRIRGHAHRCEEHETEQQGVHPGQRHHRAEHPRAGQDVEDDDHQTHHHRPVGADETGGSTALEGRRRRLVVLFFLVVVHFDPAVDLLRILIGQVLVVVERPSAVRLVAAAASILLLAGRPAAESGR